MEEKLAKEKRAKRSFKDVLAEQKKEAIKVSGDQKMLEENEKLMEEEDSMMQQRIEAKEAALEQLKKKAEKEAQKKIKDATLAGIKAGEEASKKLIEDSKTQTPKESEAAIKKLKTKFEKTKHQVMDIVNNFGKIHSDLQELKSEYIQEQTQMNNYL